MSASLTSFKRRVAFGVLVLLGTGILAGLCAVLVLWLGLYDVSATSKHPWPVEWLLHFAMRRSVAFHAPELPTPSLDDPFRIERGALHYASGCAPCHGAPGELASPIGQEITPVPPGLYSAALDFDPSQLFWIVKHGVKMTAMPAWPAPEREDEIWDMVAFLKHLPELNTQRYAALVGDGSDESWLPLTRPASMFDPVECTRCHGVDGKGRDGAFPPISSMKATDIVAALRSYRDGSRPSGFMQPVAAAMGDAQIDAAANYFATLAPALAP